MGAAEQCAKGQNGYHLRRTIVVKLLGAFAIQVLNQGSLAAGVLHKGNGI